MMLVKSNWVPFLQEVFEDSGSFTARIVWVNEIEGKKSAQDIPLAGIRDLEVFKNVLRNDRNTKLDTSIELVKILNGLVGKPLDITAEVIEPNKPTELELFLVSYQKLQSIKRKVDAKLIEEDDSRYLEVLKETQSLLTDDNFLFIG